MHNTSQYSTSQNFLHAQRVDELIEIAGIAAGDCVCDIGAGTGNITAAILQKVGESGRVIAIEADPSLAEHLRTRLATYAQLTVIESDVLQVPLDDFASTPILFSNLPFSITAGILHRFFVTQTVFSHAYVIVQRDTFIHHSEGVTQKHLLLYPRYIVTELCALAPTDFSPVPSVACSFFALKQRAAPLLTAKEYALYCDFVTVISKDRCGEGVWRRLFSPDQLMKLSSESGLVLHRGIASQSPEAVVAAWRVFVSANADRIGGIRGAYQRSFDLSLQLQQHNAAGGHHASKMRRKHPRRR